MTRGFLNWFGISMLLAAGKFSLVDKNTLSGTAVRLSTCAGGLALLIIIFGTRSGARKRSEVGWRGYVLRGLQKL